MAFADTSQRGPDTPRGVPQAKVPKGTSHQVHVKLLATQNRRYHVTTLLLNAAAVPSWLPRGERPAGAAAVRAERPDGAPRGRGRGVRAPRGRRDGPRRGAARGRGAAARRGPAARGRAAGARPLGPPRVSRLARELGMFYANKADKQHGDRCIATRGHGRSGFSAARLEHYLALDGSWLAPALADLTAQVPWARNHCFCTAIPSVLQ